MHNGALGWQIIVASVVRAVIGLTSADGADRHPRQRNRAATPSAVPLGGATVRAER